MLEVIVKRPTQEELNELNVDSWSTWECDASTFDWTYDDEEVCYFYEGEVMVETSDDRYEIAVGDLVTFPKGLDCRWHVYQPVRKVFKFNT